MIQQTSGNGKIIKRVLVDGDISHTFKIVRNKRKNNIPSHEVLAKIGCFRKSEFTADAEKFWTIADEKLSALVDAGVLWLTDKTKIEKQFEAVIPRRPALPVKYWVTKNPPKTTRV
jgi:hypothetical protein